MNEQFQQFIDSLYPENRSWKDKEIIDIMLYFNVNKYAVKYIKDIVYLFNAEGKFVKAFVSYNDFINYIVNNIK